MNTLLSLSARITGISLLGFWLSLSACGAAEDPLGGGSQPICEGDGPDDAEEGGGGDACAIGEPVSEAQSCQVVAQGLCFADAEAACACDGCGIQQCAIAESFPAQAFCQDAEPGSSDPNAPVSDEGEASNGSSCGGQPGGGSDPHPGGEACAAGAPRQGSNGPCDFIVGELCFTSGDAACACAGCAADACLVLESYPAQIRCATNE